MSSLPVRAVTPCHSLPNFRFPTVCQVEVVVFNSKTLLVSDPPAAPAIMKTLLFTDRPRSDLTPAGREAISVQDDSWLAPTLISHELRSPDPPQAISICICNM